MRGQEERVKERRRMEERGKMSNQERRVEVRQGEVERQGKKLLLIVVHPS